MTEADSESGQRPGNKKPQEFKFEIDPNLSGSLQGGLEAIQNVFGGLVQTIKDAVGPETLRNLEVGNWLEQLATCLDQIAAGLREAGAVPADKSGELAFYVEQFESEIRGSKFENQLAAWRQRLDTVMHTLQQVDAGSAAEKASQLAEVAGYFHAAARSAVPIQFGNQSK